MKFRRLSAFVTGLGLLAIAPSNASAAALCVEPTGAGGCFMTIQAAVTAAAAGDSIQIAPAVYTEIVAIPAGTDNLAIAAAGAIIDGTGISGDALTVLANGTTIEGLSIQNFDGNGIAVGDDSGIIPTGTTLRDLRVAAIEDDCLALYGADSVLISGSSLTSCGSDAIDADNGPDNNGSDNLTIEKVVVTFGDNGCITIDGDNAQVSSSKLNYCEDDDCIYVSGDNALVQGNKMSGCDGSSVEVDGDNAVIQKNKARLTYGAAFEVEGANATIIKNKAAYSGGGIDITSDPCDGGTVVGNQLSDLVGYADGVKIECLNGTGGLLVEKNKVSRASGTCFRIEGSGVTVRGNKAVVCGGESTSSGFAIAAIQSTITANFAKGVARNGFAIEGSDNTVSGNKSSANYGSGFAVGDGATGVVLSGNSSSGNLGAGYAVYDGSTVVTLSGNSSSDAVPHCQDDPGSTIIDGMGNSFSLAAPPICPLEF